MKNQKPTTLSGFGVFDWITIFLIAAFAILGALHILFGLREVVKALVHPATAAWVQAIGALAAIAIAIWVANGTERMSRESARVTAKHFIRMSSAAIGGLYVVCDGKINEEADVQRVRFLAELKEVHHIGQSIPIAPLPPKLCDLVLETRTLVARCHDLGVDIPRRPFPRPGAPSFPVNRDGYSIGVALLKASWENIKEIDELAQRL